MSGLDKRRIAENFGRAAKTYEQHAILQRTVAERLLERLALVKINPELIIDVGAGTGTTARALARRYKSAQVLQLDLSLAMLQQSRSRSRRFFSRQHYVCGDAENLPAANAGTGLVFSSLTLQWCNDPDRTFLETRRALAPGGLFLFATLGPDTLRELRACWSALDNDAHVNTFLDMHDIGDALVRAGMENVVMDMENIVMNYPDCSALLRDLKKVGAHNANNARPRGLTGKHKMQGLAAAYEKFRRNGMLPATYEVVYGHAWAPSAGTGMHKARETYVPISAISLRKR